MFFVDLRLPPRDLASQMRDVRIWLDRHKVETSGFLVRGAMARLGFSASRHAEAFAAQFAGRIIPAPRSGTGRGGPAATRLAACVATNKGS